MKGRLERRNSKRETTYLPTRQPKQRKREKDEGERERAHQVHVVSSTVVVQSSTKETTRVQRGFSRALGFREKDPPYFAVHSLSQRG